MDEAPQEASEHGVPGITVCVTHLDAEIAVLGDVATVLGYKLQEVLRLDPSFHHTLTLASVKLLADLGEPNLIEVGTLRDSREEASTRRRELVSDSNNLNPTETQQTEHAPTVSMQI